MRYQEVAGRLLIAADGAGLVVYNAEDQLELHEMSRTFRVLCVPRDWEPPFDIRAQLEFHWPCDQTAYSLYGTDGLCALYHGEEVECTHDEFEPEPMIELEIEYHLPDNAVVDLDSTTAMTHFGQRVREAHQECVDHENLVAIRFELVFFQDRLRVSSAIASHFWLIEGEDLEDGENLASILDGICEEAHDFLVRLAELFPKPGKESRRSRPKAK